LFIIIIMFFFFFVLVGGGRVSCGGGVCGDCVVVWLSARSDFALSLECVRLRFSAPEGRNRSG
jgi:hypothetical protein